MMNIYCPICQKIIVPINQNEVDDGAHQAFIYLHDDIEHSDEDMEALINGIQ